jgi:hypothetical protein
VNNIDPLTPSLRHSGHELNSLYHYYAAHCLDGADADEVSRTKVDVLRKRVFELGTNLLSSSDHIGPEKVADAIEDLTSPQNGFSGVHCCDAVDLHGAGTNAHSTYVGIQKYIIQTEKDRRYG